MSVLNSSDSSDSSPAKTPFIDDNRPATPQNKQYPDATIGVQATPFVKRIASVRLPDDASELKVIQMAKMWKLDLTPEEADTFIDGEFNLVMTAFEPPFTVDSSLLANMNKFSFVTGWRGLPDEWTEDAAATFLNSVVNDIGRASGQTPRRSWCSQYCNQILPGSPIKRKPDIVLLDVNHEEPVTWRNIRAITEVTRSKTEVDRMVDTINDKTFIMFTTQFNRTFVPMISIFDNRFRLTVTDRQGQLRSVVYNLLGPHPNHALHLIHLLATLCFGSPGAIGYDPSVITNSRDETTAIICDKVTYNVLHCIYAVQGLVGRATHVFLVELNNQQFILKDSWIEQSRPCSETRHLRRIQGVQGVPVLHQGWDVKFSNKLLSTWLIRLGNYGIYERSRVRRRLVSSTIGVPISQFRTKRELISAFRDVTQTHSEICYTRNTVHRDVSYNNIMLYKEEDATTKLRRGLLIDFDYAAKIKDRGKISPGRRTARILYLSTTMGTAPFMALDILISELGGIWHEPRFDLESLFYVLIYLCINLKGPENRVRPTEDVAAFRSFPVAEWFRPEGSYRRLGRAKLAQLQTLDESILPYISPYFFDLIPCIKNFYIALCPEGDSRNSPVTHSQVIAIFEETLAILPETENLPPDILQIPSSLQHLSGNIVSDGRKRSLFDVDNYGIPPSKRSRRSTNDIYSS